MKICIDCEYQYEQMNLFGGSDHLCSNAKLETINNSRKCEDIRKVCRGIQFRQKKESIK